MRVNNSINKLINKIKSKKTTFLNNLTLVIFNFRINIDYFQIITRINIKILFIKIIKNFNIRSQTCQRLRSSFLFCWLLNNFCNWFSKARSILNEKIKIKNRTQTTKNLIIVIKLKHSSSTSQTRKKNLRKIFTMTKKSKKNITLSTRIWNIIIQKIFTMTKKRSLISQFRW